MKSIAKLKERARLHEQEGEWAEAIRAYQQAITAAEEGAVEADFTLFNRIGDLYLRLGQQYDAVRYYEQAADHYEAAGFYNNAIALCNKALRQQPERVELYRKLGRLSIVQGFMTDARRWLLEYVERTLGGGRAAEAAHALDELAHLAVAPEIWEALAECFSAKGESELTVAQLLRAYGAYRREGVEAQAERVRGRVLVLDAEADFAAAEAAVADAAIGAGDDDFGDEGGELPGLGLQSAADSAGIEAAVADGAPAEAMEIEPTILEADAPLPELEPAAAGADEPLPALEPTALDAGAGEEIEALPMLDLADFGATSLPTFDAEEAAPLPELVAPSLLEPVPAPPEPKPASPASRPARLARVEAPPPPTRAAPAAGFVDLVALIQGEDEDEEDTRFVVPAKPPTGDEDQDFLDMLEQFKTKVNEHIDPDDAASHYDLGLAFKEMGLLDEAIGQFQTALHALSGRLKVYEELGDCFMLKGQYTIAAKLLERALHLPDADDAGVIGVCYQLGRCYEALERPDAARDAYERVMTMDIQFRDVADRLARL